MQENTKLNRKEDIEKQRSDLASSGFFFRLIRPCTLNDGILPYHFLEKRSVPNDFEEDKVGFFIPASGSGSRMFSFLESFIHSGKENELSSLFFRKIDSFAFTHGLSLNKGASMSLTDKIELSRKLLYEEPFSFSNKPKGLIPFFNWGGSILTPFVVHVQQGIELFGEDPHIHFTVQEKYEREIREHLAEHFPFSIRNITFSHQDQESDAYCFDEDLNPIFRNSVPLRRPSGHGALLSNLNAYECDYVFIKNIDNLQLGTGAVLSNEIWLKMLGVLKEFRQELYEAVQQQDLTRLAQLNERYQFISNEELADSAKAFENLSVRPIRICGMVRNEGKPGGGPFWIEVEEGVSKQIVELSQVSAGNDQSIIVKESTHFNPVFMICSMRDANDNDIDLNRFVNPDLFLKVVKSDAGQEIQFRELPGLWNGSMHFWTTIFVEIPGSVFTPVKTALDLL